MAHNYQICEFGIIKRASDFDDAVSSLNELYLPSDEFQWLHEYILANQAPDGQKDIPFSLFTKANKLHIKVHNYVGILETNQGLSLEILPKIHRSSIVDELSSTRKIFLKMLRCLKDSPFLNLNTAHLSTQENFPILEVFITSYINELERLLNLGIKSDYLLQEGNLNYLKGKILVSQNIRFNLFNHSKFYCEFSELSANIPQNRLIKSTLLKLLKITRSHYNYATANKLLTHLDSIPSSRNFRADLKRSLVKNRLFKPYEQLLKWSEIFLLNKGLTNFQGHMLNIAILFPMEKIFESYTAHMFKKYASVHTVTVQDRTYFLVEKHGNDPKFRLRPDLYMENLKNDRIIVDTKWKIIDETKPGNNYGIQMADMYQLYAYGKKYSTADKHPRLIVLYPKTEFFTKKLEPFTYEDGMELNVFPFDLTANEEEEVQKIMSAF